MARPGDDQVVVVGAGVIGLTTAICLAEAGRTVRVWTDRPPLATTSVVAGAMWGPSMLEPAAQTLRWTEWSLHEFTELAEDPETGVRLVPVLTVGDALGGELPPEARLIPELRPATPDELPAGFRTGFRSRMPLADMPRYLPYLERRLAAAGGVLEQRTVASLAEAAAEAPVVLNCSGLGARELAGDPEVRPVFGQHVMLTNPGLDRLFLELTMAPEWVSFFPQPHRVVCGGIRIPDRWDTTPDPDLTERIVERCRRVEPRLRDAEVIETVTGLRPVRPAVRVEAERLGAALVVHNYGHGGNGVSLSWGSARAAAELAGVRAGR
ncbi:MAG TPA: FAD-dependent oxidoreductase [Actinophytocola sp.]|uniref:FAD-dependent oxidoreductase n=1 Tax=Actinophytocola sp. TaxID=1872138 RepID=UPI002DB67D05|nr:FAD-dependent oxidoreductase [Actinophytocola sp.]HEU5473522.1 FAD-dependent oxidoreductase [Actinophytocola sp.]